MTGCVCRRRDILNRWKSTHANGNYGYIQMYCHTRFLCVFAKSSHEAVLKYHNVVLKDHTNWLVAKWFVFLPLMCTNLKFTWTRFLSNKFATRNPRSLVPLPSSVTIPELPIRYTTGQILQSLFLSFVIAMSKGKVLLIRAIWYSDQIWALLSSIILTCIL